MTDNFKSKEPLYMRIAARIREQILSGKLKSGDPVKSMRLLAIENNVSVITTKKAYQILVDEKLLTAFMGKGYFVTDLAKEMSAEYHLRNIENNLSDAVCSAKSVNLGINEIYNILKTLWKDDMCHRDTSTEEQCYEH